MAKNPSGSVWTIGHSNRSIEAFLNLLQHYKIKAVVDVRQFPGSRKYPHFNKENLSITLSENNLQYIHLLELGGRRKPNPDSPYTSWRHPAFRSYADYMDTDAFSEGIDMLEKIALQQETAYMCSEAVWWSCHRSMISDYLKVRGWEVNHILSPTKAELHPYTSPARIIDGKLSYLPG